ncbi:MAG: PDZ domain-containing protein [Acidobacteria bacterium]|nr:PDZ domain-containing protein [Acidobacteriota bacterium]
MPPPKVQPRIAAPIPTPAPALTDAMSANPNVHVAEWVVSVIHKVEVNKLLERMRKETRAQVGVPGSMPEFVYNVTTGVVIDDHGHIITRLANLDPEDKEQNISIVTNSGQSLPAKFIGLDCPSGFAVLEVAALKVAAPETAPPVTQGKLVRILSADVEQKVAANNYPKRFDILPSIKAMSGQIETESPYAQARGALTLRSANLRSRNDSAIVTTLENQLVGVAQYVGFGRAYLFPIDLLRNTIAKRVLEKQATVLTGWLGVTGENLFQMSPQEFQALGIERRIGVVVKEVSPNSPAAQSGLKAKDVIIGFDNFEVASTNDLSTFLSSSPSGKTITLRTIRDQQPVEIHVVLGVKASSQPLIAVQQFEAQPQTIAGQIDETRRRIEELQGQYRFYQKMPKTDEREESLKELTIELRELFEAMRVLEAAQAEENSKYPEANSYSTQPVKKSCTLKTGFTAWEMPKQLADSFGTPKSVLVDSVRKGSAAEVAGLKAGDVLVSATGEALTCAQTEALFANPFATLTLRVLRKKQPLSLLIKP